MRSSASVTSLIVKQLSPLLARNEKNIVDLAVQLHAKGFRLKQEGEANGFLGVHIEHNPKTGFLNKTQKGLHKEVLKTLGLDV